MKVINNRFTEAKETATNVTKNAAELVQSTSLVIVAGYSAYAIKLGQVDGMFAYVLAAAAAIIAVRGAYEFLRTLNKK